ncbi:predicted protein [Naegleria gruberi]|uniref:Predicted protein n=1 Tax=Naegleria gruberi TaxID=5762 RepID=D2W0W5_NAEGR|nr:uncharacterized protein NAEGRDRAFT_53830 [Naegleria gruberi]EFC37251.1 predicted protein [Naegleria gruberi]|eukprot:XP_002669995.1 predicted protein [Naegleria gruberi strain NEG-M]
MQQQTENNLSSSILLGDLIAKYPKGGPLILNKLGIDYCCGGQRSLISVVQESSSVSNIEEECLSIIKQVQEMEIQCCQQQEDNNNTSTSLQQGMVDWKASQLVQHIIHHHHDYLRENIPVLSQLLLKIYTVHMGKLIQQARQSSGENEQDVASTHPSILLMEKMYKIFQSLATELLVHLVKEEKDVFPLIIQYDEQQDKSNPFLKSKLASLMEDHDEAGKLIKLLASMRKELPDYCKTVENTKRLLTELEENLYIHVHLENNILFKRVLSSLNI